MTSSRQFSGRKRATALAVATTGLLATTGLMAGPAQSAPTSQCPPSYAVADLTKGDPVTGLTVTSGTDPDSFGGTVVGVLENGIGPGVDMILVDLTSPTIDRVGIWSGMSGSPVYAANDELIGAVSYSLGLGPSTIAGVTPSAEMQKLLRDGGTSTMTLRRTVALPQSLRTSLARSGAIASASAPASMSQLQVPVSLSGLTAQRRASAARVLHLGGAKAVDMAGGPTSSEEIGIAAGGNLAASMSYGTVTAAGVGTATAVCGDEILAFGHPMNYSGPSTMALHGARATHIQDDPTLSGFKSANIGAPIGTVDADRLAGLHAVTGALPAGIPFTAVATSGGAPFTASTQVVSPEVLPDIGFANTLAANDKVMDRVGKGTASSTWTIKGLRKDGTPFTFTHKDLYADPSDISGATAFALVGDLQAIVENPGETVKITSVESSTKIIDDATTFVVQKAQVLRSGKWVALRTDRPSPVRPGAYNEFRIFLTSRSADPRTLTTKVFVPAQASGRVGYLNLLGGQEDSDSADEYFDSEEEAFDDATPAPTSATFPAVLKDLVAAQQHNQVRVTLRFPGAAAPGNKTYGSTATTNRVVLGHLRLPVVGQRRTS